MDHCQFRINFKGAQLREPWQSRDTVLCFCPLQETIDRNEVALHVHIEKYTDFEKTSYRRWCTSLLMLHVIVFKFINKTSKLKLCRM